MKGKAHSGNVSVGFLSHSHTLTLYLSHTHTLTQMDGIISGDITSVSSTGVVSEKHSPCLWNDSIYT